MQVGLLAVISCNSNGYLTYCSCNLSLPSPQQELCLQSHTSLTQSITAVNLGCAKSVHSRNLLLPSPCTMPGRTLAVVSCNSQEYDFHLVCCSCNLPLLLLCTISVLVLQIP